MQNNSGWKAQALLLLGLAITANPLIAKFALDAQRLEVVTPFLWLLAGGAVGVALVLLFARKKIKTLFTASPLFASVSLIFLLMLYFESNLIAYAKWKLVRNVLIAGIWLLTASAFQQHIILKTRKRLSQGIFSLILGLFTLFCIAEIALAWPARTHAYAKTFANNTWFERYGGPVNADGYRDYDYSEADAKRRKIVLMLGDSYLAGPGIENVENRFSNTLAKNLGTDFLVLNRGRGGNDVRHALKELAPFSPPAYRVIYCWTPNDILGAADTLEDAFGRRFSYSGIFGPLIERSYALNYLYWSFPHSDFPDFLPRLKGLFANEKLMQQHIAQIRQLEKMAKSRGAEFNVVLFPYPQDVAATDEFPAKMQDYLKRESIISVDVSIYWKDYAGSELVVNRNDGHPNETAHRVIAHPIYYQLFEKPKEFLKPVPSPYESFGVTPAPAKSSAR